jgi:hypothetical protein
MWRQFTLVVSIKDKGLDGGNDDGVKTITGDATRLWALLAICSLAIKR